MGELKICDSHRTNDPFFHNLIAIHLYSLEELCFYMEMNLFLLDEGWIGDQLFSWIGEKLGMPEIEKKLRVHFSKERDVYSCASILFHESGFYTQRELTNLDEMINGMRGKSPMERRKICGDRLLMSGRYRRAVYCYLELLDPECTKYMTEELWGNIYHNLGVAYAHMFMFNEAAEMFLRAYKKRALDISRDAYLMSLNYLPDTYDVDETGMNINYDTMKQVLAKFTDAGENVKNYHERKTLSDMSSRVNWKNTRQSLVEKWRDEYTRMVE